MKYIYITANTMKDLKLLSSHFRRNDFPDSFRNDYPDSFRRNHFPDSGCYLSDSFLDRLQRELPVTYDILAGLQAKHYSGVVPRHLKERCQRHIPTTFEDDCLTEENQLRWHVLRLENSYELQRAYPANNTSTTNNTFSTDNTPTIPRGTKRSWDEAFSYSYSMVDQFETRNLSIQIPLLGDTSLSLFNIVLLFTVGVFVLLTIGILIRKYIKKNNN